MRWFVGRGWHGWVAVLVVVLLFDVAAAIYDGEPMTAATRRWFANGGAGKWIVVVLMAYLAIHLTVMPQRMDPLDRTFVWIREKTVARRAAPSAPERQPAVTTPSSRGEDARTG